MASITSAGIGSGLDVNGLISQLIAAERQPVVALDRKEAVYQAQLSAYGSLKGALSTFQSNVQRLSGAAAFQALTASSADTSVFTASASSIAVAGSYAVEVKQLAQSHKLASKAFDTVTDTVGTGTLTIQFGTYSGGVFTANAAKAAQTVSIDSAHGTLSGVRDAINAANVGVTATILNDGTGNKLVLTAGEAGAANSLKITVADGADASNVDDAGLSQLAYDPTGSAGNGKNLTQTVSAQNALLKVDGIDNISKASNTVSDVIQGVTLTLRKVSTADSPTTLTVARDTAAVTSAVESFVKAYNDINSTIKGFTAYDATTKQAAILQGDASVLSIMSQIRGTLNSTITGLTGSYGLLSQIGVSFQTDGTLALDSTKLAAAVGTNFNDIAGLFANLGRPTDSLVSYVGATDKTAAGSYAINITQLAARGYLNGAGTAALADTAVAGTFDTAFVVDAGNETFGIKVDGIQSGVISLTQASYATAAALTAEIQSKINGDSAFKAAGVTVTVSFDSASDRLVVTSDRYGSASNVEVTSVDTDTAATLGLGIASGTAGVDVAGSINGAAASGSGRYLTGATGSAAEGLKLEIVGGATGSRGTIGYSQGYAYKLDKLVGRLLGTTGPIESRTQGINGSIEDVGERREVLERRLLEIERRYRAQFTALDTLLGRLRTTSDFLTRQLAVLPGVSSQG